MIDSIINCDVVGLADTVILGAGYDATASHLKGAVNGPSAIIKSISEDIEFFDIHSKTEPGYLYKIAAENLGNLNHLDPEKMVEFVSENYRKLIDMKKFTVLLGGEHSVSLGALRAFSDKLNPKDVTILQIDAHPDLRDDDSNSNPNQSSPSKFAHACVMRRAHELGFNIVQVGIRSYSKEEYEFFTREKNITVFEWSEGKKHSIEEIIKAIKTKKIYISIDIDGFDPAHMPATGTPVPGGIEWYFGSDLILSLINKKDLIGADIVEVSPRPNDVLTEYAAAQLCYKIISSQLLKQIVR